MSEDKRPAPGMSWWDKAAIGAMGGVGGALSYDALQQMAVAMHIRPELTYLFPVAIDGFIAYGTRALVVLKDAPLRARAYTWSVFGSATATSVWANWTHAVRLNDISAPGEGLHLPDWSVGVLSTIAPLVLGGATHLYIVMSRHASGADAEPQADADTQGLGDADQTSLQSAPDQDAGAKPAVRTRWWNRKRAAAPEVDNAASATADQHHELSAVSTPSPVSLTKAPEGPAALPAGPAAASGPQPQAVPVPVPVPGTEAAAGRTVPGPQTSVPGSGTAAGDGTVPTPRTVPASGAVPTPGTALTPGPSGTVPAPPEPKPGTVPGTPASRAPESSPAGTVPTVPAAPAPRVHAAPPAVPAAALPATEPGSGDGAGPVPNLTAASRPGDAAAAGRVSAATATAPHRVPTPAPSPVPPVPAPAQAEAARPRDPGTATVATVLRAVPAPGTESAGTGPATRPGPVPAWQAGPRSGTEPTPVPAAPAGDRPGRGTVPTINTASGTVPVSRSPVPGTDPGPDREVRKRQLSDDELEALLPIGRTVAATAEGRLTREALRAGLRAQNVPINNIALGQLLRELKDIEGKPPPSRR
ncbi:DUF2637 domain-containing protein [Kitasatospora sp. NPDC059973]|uniref:DUF2637 domain-containing protein n=1 Tax=Kitasatospora sp. NPDC059973 TaxID=3347020 RepID=UPI0036744A77